MTDPHVSAARQARVVFLAAAVGLLVYEATKTALLPRLTLWQSHAVTIVFGSVVAYVAARRALHVQATLHARVLEESTTRARIASEEASLRASELRFRELVEQSPEAIVLHRAGDVVYANAAALRLLHARALDDVRGRGLVAWLHPDDHAPMEARIAALTAGRPVPGAAEYRLLALDGQMRIVEATSVAVRHEGEAAFQTVLRDVTERKRLERELVHQAFHDTLTGLANRALFRERVEHALTHVSRGERVATLFVDVDAFKTVNDSLGHAAGDALLQSVANRLLNATRGCDTVARLGGDEFGVLVERMQGEDDALVVADRIVAAMAAPFTIDERRIVVGVSVGIARATTTDDVESVLRNADIALYAAKEQGKGRAVVFESEMFTAARERMELEEDLRPALERGELALVYQPIVDLATGRVTGVEALLRWHHPQRGVVSPAAFIPIAERTGLILPIGRWVLMEACRQVTAWHARFPSQALAVSVNVSGRQLQDPALVRDVEDALAASALPPRRLVLEITETVMMRDADATLARLRVLKGLGVRLAIDDFGTGYSSLAYLRQFPVDILKIDKTFVDGVGHGGDESVLATAIVTLGESLSLTTVAEGIEDTGQATRLRELGCDRGQGYLFARPMTADDLDRRLAQETVRS